MRYAMRIKRLPHQMAFTRSTARHKALITGYGGGKTLIGAAEIIKHSIQDPGLFHMAVSPSFPVAKKTVIPTIEEILETRFSPPLVKGKDWTFHKTEHYFHIKPWNGKIWVGSGEKPDSLKGPNLASVWIDEPGVQDAGVYRQMIARLRAPNARNPQIFLTGTPEGLNWLSDLCEGETRPADFDLIRGDTRDNAYLPPAYIAGLLEQYDEQLVKAYLQGLFVNLAQGNAYHAFSDANLIDPIEIDPRREICLGMDFNYSPMTSVACQEYNEGGRAVVKAVKDFAFQNCSTDAACERIIEDLGRDKHYVIFPDPACQARSAHGAGISDLSLIQQTFSRLLDGGTFRVMVRPSHPARKDRLNAVNSRLRNAAGVIGLQVSRSCKHVIKDFRRVLMEEFLGGNFKDPSLGHVTDALGYYIDFRYPVRSGVGRYTSDKEL